MTTMRGVWLVGVLVLAVAMAGVAAANQPPQAEAGLDQEAVVNGTVYLDAGGSLDPDGRIVDYAWSIETPGGNATTPDCPSCVQTQFVPRENGTYAVTVTVTDDEGVTMADTMYVYVDASEVENTSNDGGESSETSVSAPSSSVGGSGGGGGGGASIALDSVAADSNGNRYLLNRDGGDFTFHTRDGETVEISQERFSEMANENGEVPWEKAEYEFQRKGVTDDDIDDSMHEGSCGGFTCTSVSDRSGVTNDFSDVDVDMEDFAVNTDIVVDAATPGTIRAGLSPN